MDVSSQAGAASHTRAASVANHEPSAALHLQLLNRLPLSSVVLETEPQDACMLGKCSNIEL